MNAKKTAAQQKKQETISKITWNAADVQHGKATTYYDQHYDNDLYLKAIRHLNNKAANRLIDIALAICGSPYYRLDRVTLDHLSQAQLDFLAAFQE